MAFENIPRTQTVYWKLDMYRRLTDMLRISYSLVLLYTFDLMTNNMAAEAALRAHNLVLKAFFKNAREERDPSDGWCFL